MSTRSTFALITLAAATVASVATSPPRWEIDAEADGAEIVLDATTTTASMHIDVDAVEIPDEAYGELSVYLSLEGLVVDDEGDPATLDAVLVQETDDGDVELDAVTGWTDATNETSSIHLSAGDISHESATYRVDVELVDGGSASFNWNAYVHYEVEGDGANDIGEGPTVDVTLDPAAPAEEI